LSTAGHLDRAQSGLYDSSDMTAAMLVLEPIFEVVDLPPEIYDYRAGRKPL